MKYKFNYGSEVVTLPRAAAEYLRAASRKNLAVLISLAAEPSMTAKKRAEVLSLTEDDVAAALAYWTALGVISPERAAKTGRQSAAHEDTESSDEPTMFGEDETGAIPERRAFAE